MGPEGFNNESMFMYHLCNLEENGGGKEGSVTKHSPGEWNKEKWVVCGFYEQ